MAWTAINTTYPIVHIVNDEGNVAEAYFDETADPKWVIKLRYGITAETAANELHSGVLAALNSLIS